MVHVQYCLLKTRNVRSMFQYCLSLNEIYVARSNIVYRKIKIYPPHPNIVCHKTKIYGKHSNKIFCCKPEIYGLVQILLVAYQKYTLNVPILFVIKPKYMGHVVVKQNNMLHVPILFVIKQKYMTHVPIMFVVNQNI